MPDRPGSTAAKRCRAHPVSTGRLSTRLRRKKLTLVPLPARALAGAHRKAQRSIAAASFTAPLPPEFLRSNYSLSPKELSHGGADIFVTTAGPLPRYVPSAPVRDSMLRSTSDFNALSDETSEEC